MRRLNAESRQVRFLASLFSIALFLVTGCSTPETVEARWWRRRQP